MATPQKQDSQPGDLSDFLAELDADFGKKKRGSKEPPHKELNRQFHAANPGTEGAAGKSPEDPMFHWVPQARITYVIRQVCRTCRSQVNFIGGEYIRFISKRQRAVITRRADQCADLWHFGWGQDPTEVPDLTDEMVQEVARCVGCIEVERQAIEIWEEALRQQTKQPEQSSLDLPGLEDL